ncbi:phosphoribosylamine--glycine ligase [Elusimicrobium simillimum]|uniref:phosphoribosylamine--glycine ligase n=1 Tax=Elusimicrobium simillimum TaxID=3143438 RepID=UPI003C6EAD38
MNILIVGGGGREHALAWKIAESKLASIVYSSVAAAEGGKIKFNFADMSTNENVVAFCKTNAVDLVVVGPEAPLAAGLADALRAANIKVFGTVKAGAKLEYSKEYSKEFMQKYNIPTAAYASFTDLKPAQDYVQNAALPIVVKADGLAAGKGVRVCLTKEEAMQALTDFMADSVLGASGHKVVVEEFLDGKEASIMAFVDGDSYKVLPVSRDHKRLLDGDKGPNTGGMGVYTPVADITAADIEFVKTNVFDNVIKGLKAEGIDYCGIIYAGIMKGSQGTNVLEFNCRFGDPETQTVLPVLKEDLLEIILACCDKKLNSVADFANTEASVCVILAGGDYPAAPSKGIEITGLENVKAQVFHSGTKKENGKFYTNGGRVLAVAATAATMAEAREKVYTEIQKINFKGMQFRRDIGA